MLNCEFSTKKCFYCLIIFSLISIILFTSNLKKNDYFSPKTTIDDLNREFDRSFNRIFQSSTQKNATNSTNYKCKVYTNLNATRQVKINDVYYPRLVSLHSNNSINFKCLERKIRRKKSILIWNHPLFYSHATSYSLSYDFKCPISKCVLTSDKSQLDLSDAVIFNLNNLPISMFETTKRKNQKWINYASDPIDGEQIMNSNFFESNENSFDWSASYDDSNSDFMSLAYRALNLTWDMRETSKIHASQNLVNRENLVATLINECDEDDDAYKDYLKFINLLNKHVNVDVYGECGKPCPGNKNESKCFAFLEENYKFFLVLERKICTNYKSERFFSILKYNIVPIVLKSYDLDLYLPRSSFIEALSFASIKLLASYLLELNTNHVDYMKFFEWKTYANVNHFHSDSAFGVASLLCDICIKLNLESVYNNDEKEKSNHLARLDSLKTCSKLNLKSVVALFYMEPLTDKDPNIFSVFGIVKKFFKYDLFNLYFSKSFSGIIDRVYGLY